MGFTKISYLIISPERRSALTGTVFNSNFKLYVLSSTFWNIIFGHGEYGYNNCYIMVIYVCESFTLIMQVKRMAQSPSSYAISVGDKLQLADLSIVMLSTKMGKFL